MKDDPFVIPAFLDRRGEKTSPTTRKANPEVEARREAHRIAPPRRNTLARTGASFKPIQSCAMPSPSRDSSETEPSK
jgi:hypothetical protein